MHLDISPTHKTRTPIAPGSSALHEELAQILINDRTGIQICPKETNIALRLNDS